MPFPPRLSICGVRLVILSFSRKTFAWCSVSCINSNAICHCPLFPHALMTLLNRMVSHWTASASNFSKQLKASRHRLPHEQKHKMGPPVLNQTSMHLTEPWAITHGNGKSMSWWGYELVTHQTIPPVDSKTPTTKSTVALWVITDWRLVKSPSYNYWIVGIIIPGFNKNNIMFETNNAKQRTCLEILRDPDRPCTTQNHGNWN